MVLYARQFDTAACTYCHLHTFTQHVRKSNSSLGWVAYVLRNVYYVVVIFALCYNKSYLSTSGQCSSNCKKHSFVSNEHCQYLNGFEIMTQIWMLGLSLKLVNDLCINPACRSLTAKNYTSSTAGRGNILCKLTAPNRLWVMQLTTEDERGKCLSLFCTKMHKTKEKPLK